MYSQSKLDCSLLLEFLSQFRYLVEKIANQANVRDCHRLVKSM